MTNVCLPLLLWKFSVFLQSLQDIMQHRMMHSASIQYRSDSLERVDEYVAVCSVAVHFYLFCLPAVFVPSRLRVDVLLERNACPLGQVNRCIYSDVFFKSPMFFLCFTTHSAFSLLCAFSVWPMMMLWYLFPLSLNLISVEITNTAAFATLQIYTIFLKYVCCFFVISLLCFFSSHFVQGHTNHIILSLATSCISPFYQEDKTVLWTYLWKKAFFKLTA